MGFGQRGWCSKKGQRNESWQHMKMIVWLQTSLFDQRRRTKCSYLFDLYMSLFFLSGCPIKSKLSKSFQKLIHHSIPTPYQGQDSRLMRKTDIWQSFLDVIILQAYKPTNVSHCTLSVFVATVHQITSESSLSAIQSWHRKEEPWSMCDTGRGAL